jgi:hypothetical protein
LGRGGWSSELKSIDEHSGGAVGVLQDKTDASTGDFATARRRSNSVGRGPPRFPESAIRRYNPAGGNVGLQSSLEEHRSTDAAGFARCIGLPASSNVELAVLLAQLQLKLPRSVPLLMGELPLPSAT